MAAKKPDDLYNQIAKVVLEAAVPHLGGWMDTLGVLGKIPKTGKDEVSPAVRLSAAKNGVEFVSKFIGNVEASEAGGALLKELAKIDKEPAEE